MSKSTEILIGMAIVALAVSVSFIFYRWTQRNRVRMIKDWVRNYLSVRYGDVPNPVSINCSDDRRWPVLVGFDRPHQGTRHRMQFSCGGASSTYALLSELEEKR